MAKGGGAAIQNDLFGAKWLLYGEVEFIIASRYFIDNTTLKIIFFAIRVRV